MAAKDATPSTVETDRRRTIPAMGRRPGKLVMVGSGIKSISHMTLETVSHIEQADKVFYCVADPGTELFVKSKAKWSFDLYTLYDNDKNRYITYVQMAELCLQAARDGFFSVGVFYGHPGVFVSPSHRAIGIAQREGIEAYMLPGISAEDCLFADLGIDPSFTGCQTYEATDLLLRDRPISPHSHLIVWQVGVVGDTGFNFGGFTQTKFQVLVDRLEEVYGGDHELIHYYASTLSQSRAHIEPLRIRDLRKPEVEKRMNGISTFYVPQIGKSPHNPKTAARLGLKVDSNTPDRSFGHLLGPAVSYSAMETRAVQALKTHKPSPSYRKNRLPTSTLPALLALATSPKAVAHFRRNPTQFLEAHPDMAPHVKKVLTTGSPGLLRLLSLNSSADVAAKFVQAEFRDSTLASKYAAVLKENNGDPDGEANIIKFLQDQGYDTTPEDVDAAYLKAISVDVNTYAGYYASTFTSGGVGPSILIQNGAVTVADTVIKNPIYAQSVLQWSTRDGNAFNANLTFRILTDDDGKPLAPGAYIGPQFYGTYWKSDPEPSAPNIQGKTGTAPVKPVDPVKPVTPTPLDTFAGNFVSYKADANTGKWSEDGTFVVSDPSDSTAPTTAVYKGKTLVNYTFSGNEILAWSATDGNDSSGSISFFINKTATKTNPTLGAQASGRVWAPSESMPAKPNFFMSLGQSANPSTQSAPSQSAAEWKSVGINIGVGIATMLLGTAIIEAIKWRLKAKVDPTNPENEQGVRDSSERVSRSSEQQDAVQQESVASDESGAAEVQPNDIPVPDAPVTTTTDTTTTDTTTTDTITTTTDTTTTDTTTTDTTTTDSKCLRPPC
jgi:hypothetical protein